MAVSQISKIVKLDHHNQHELCRTRPPYRQGKRLTTVKVYTVNDESQHLIICGVPKLQLLKEIRKMLMSYGIIKEIAQVPDYPVEEFTEAFHVRYERIQSARIAKRFLDGKNFYGGILHVFYTPELESLAETRRKLIQRRRDIEIRIKRNAEAAKNSSNDIFQPKEQFHRRKRHPALPLTDNRLSQQYPGETSISIYNGIPRNIDPRAISEPSLPLGLNLKSRSCSQSSTTGMSSNISVQRKNYKGRIIDSNTKVRVIRPQLIDTKKLDTFKTITDKKVFPVVKKFENGIKIKLLPTSNEKEKRIVIKDQSTKRLIQPTGALRTSIEIAKSMVREAMKK